MEALLLDFVDQDTSISPREQEQCQMVHSLPIAISFEGTPFCTAYIQPLLALGKGSAQREACRCDGWHCMDDWKRRQGWYCFLCCHGSVAKDYCDYFLSFQWLPSGAGQDCFWWAFWNELTFSEIWYVPLKGWPFLRRRGCFCTAHCTCSRGNYTSHVLNGLHIRTFAICNLLQPQGTFFRNLRSSTKAFFGSIQDSWAVFPLPSRLFPQEAWKGPVEKTVIEFLQKIPSTLFLWFPQ